MDGAMGIKKCGRTQGTSAIGADLGLPYQSLAKYRLAKI